MNLRGISENKADKLLELGSFLLPVPSLLPLIARPFSVEDGPHGILYRH